ncbi:MAG: PD40 domain-containing protein [Fluviicola sp.]|nr:PD40 domain-containing protein [Fluviicola sp.]
MNQLLNIFLTFCIVLVTGHSFSNSSYTTPPDSTTSLVDRSAAIISVEEGKTLFSLGRIKEALIKFREAVNKDANSWKANYYIGQCHYYLNNYGYALKYANKAVKMNEEKVNKEVYFLLGESHHRLGHVEKALMHYELAKEQMPKARSRVLLVDHHIAEAKYAIEELKKEAKFSRERLVGDINSGYDDYGAILRDGGKTIYFTSRRSNTTGGGMNPDDQRYFEDTYKVTWDDEMKEWGDVTNKLGKINSDGFDAVNVISADGLTGTMTRNTTATDAKTTTRGSDLFELKMSTKGTWNSPRIIKNKTINTSYFEGSATVTADGSTMYFVTDRKGEKSSTDIYVVERNGKKWGTAKPLPMTINTKGRETTPYISPDGRYLFFSSNGHVGLGGFDIYVVENLGDSWGEPKNLGVGINTVNNDTHFSYSQELKKALVSSYEIIGKKASIDIYEIDMTNFTFGK